MGLGAAFVMPVDAVDPHQRLPGRRAARRPSRSGPASPAAAPPSARSPPGFLLEHFWWGSVFLVNVPVIIGALIVGPSPAPDLPRPRAAAARHPRRRCCRSSASAPSSTASSKARTHGWTQPADARHLRLRRRRPRPLRPAGAAHGAPDARPPLLQGPPLQRRLGRHDAHLLRHVRHVLPRRRSTSSWSSGYTALESGLFQLPMAFVMMGLSPQVPQAGHPLRRPRVVPTGLAVRRRRPAACSRFMGVDTAIWWMYGPILCLAAGMALTMSPAHHADHVGRAAHQGRRRLGDERHHPRARRRPGRRRARLARDLDLHLVHGRRRRRAARRPQRAVAESGLVGAFNVAGQLGSGGDAASSRPPSRPSSTASAWPPSPARHRRRSPPSCPPGCSLGATSSPPRWRPPSPTRPRTSSPWPTEHCTPATRRCAPPIVPVRPSARGRRRSWCPPRRRWPPPRRARSLRCRRWPAAGRRHGR